MSISGIQGSAATSGVFASQPNQGAARADQFLNALRSIDPKLADQLGTQIQSLRDSGASPQQIGQALRQTISQLSPADQADVQQAFQSIRGGHHHHHHHGAGSTSGSTSNTSSGATSATDGGATSPFGAFGTSSAIGGDGDGDADDGAAGSTLNVQA